MKKMIVLVLGMTLISSTAFGFHAVTEILPSGKLLICKDYHQVKKGNIAEVYKRASPGSNTDLSTIKAGEIKLPEAGQKIKLSHGGFRFSGGKSNFYSEELGTATISDQSLEGEERMTYSIDNSRFSRRVEKSSKITKEEALEIKNNCLVAIPDNGLKINESATVSFQ